MLARVFHLNITLNCHAFLQHSVYKYILQITDIILYNLCIEHFCPVQGRKGLRGVGSIVNDHRVHSWSNKNLV